MEKGHLIPKCRVLSFFRNKEFFLFPDFNSPAFDGHAGGRTSLKNLAWTCAAATSLSFEMFRTF